MNQTSAIAAALVIGFVVFITVRGELPAYLAVFTGAAGGAAQLPNGQVCTKTATGMECKPARGQNVLSSTLADFGLGGPPVRIDFPGYNPGFNYFGGVDVEQYWACMMDPDCKQAR